MTERCFPNTEWEKVTPEAAGFSSAKLAQLEDEIKKRSAGDPYRILIIRNGKIVSEWVKGIEARKRTKIASVRKSIYSSILGIAIREGQISSIHDLLEGYYPEALEVLPGEGPKESRHARSKDRQITLQHLISNTSGYMKPKETPGEVFHYQTFAMNVLIHAIAKRYGLYDLSEPEDSPGFKILIDSRLRVPLQASWRYRLTNFELPDSARLPIFGYSTDLEADHRDMGRLGWLWCQQGRWKNQQLIPESWMVEATKTAAPIVEHRSKEQWRYGYGFWTNDYGQLWPSLPKDSFAASGAGKQHIWVCPGLDLTVVQSPGIYERQEDLGRELLSGVVNAITS